MDNHAVMMLKIVIAKLISSPVALSTSNSDLAPLREIQFISLGVRQQIHQFINVSYVLWYALRPSMAPTR